MNDPKLDYIIEFPVELGNPDISAYKKSNTGVDYIISLDSGLEKTINIPHIIKLYLLLSWLYIIVQ